MKFTIRDLFLVTLVVAVCVAWWVDRQLHPDELRAAQRWRTRAGALEEVLHDSGWQVQWELESVHLTKGRRTIVIDTNAYEPGPLPNSSAPAPTPPKP